MMERLVRRRTATLFLVVALVAAAAALVLVAAARPAVSPPGGWRPVAVWPVPQQYQARVDGFALPDVVGVVRAADTDPAALDVVVATLRERGVGTVDLAERDPGTQVTVWLGETATPLAQLGVAGMAGLPPEGYVLADGHHGARWHAVLAGVDPAGQYHAAQTLRQLVTSYARPAWVPGVEIRDWPAMPMRGSVEGFYGPPWTQAERLDHLDYLAAHHMNRFIYSPKEDSYLRESWREPFPAQWLADLATLVGRASYRHVTVTVALSPGLSMCYTSAADQAALLAKLEAAYEVGVRSFAVAFDDLERNDWHCAEDAERYGTDPAGEGTAQVWVLHQVRDWARGRGDVTDLMMVPTEYYDVVDTPYKQALREQLDPEVVVLWTGVGVVPDTITVEEAAAAREVFGHDILVWDNYPVNDYIGGRLPLAPYTGRQPGLSREVVGVLSNPANQAAASRLALFSVAAFGWHDFVHDPQRAWSAAVDELAGGDHATVAALVVFVDLSTMDGTLHTEQAPMLGAAINEFWRQWWAGERQAALDRMRGWADAVATAPDQIRAGVTDPAFASDAAAWLAATSLWGEAMQAAVEAMAALDAGDRAAARRAVGRITATETPLRELRERRRPNEEPLLGDGVVDAFVADVVAEVDRGTGRASGAAG